MTKHFLVILGLLGSYVMGSERYKRTNSHKMVIKHIAAEVGVRVRALIRSKKIDDKE